MLEIQATRDRAADGVGRDAASGSRSSRPRSPVPGPRRSRGEPDEARTLAALQHSDARMSAVAEELARFGSSARSAAAEADRLERQRQAAETRPGTAPHGAVRPGEPAVRGRIRGGAGGGRPGSSGTRWPSGPRSPGNGRWRPGWSSAPPRNGRRATAGNAESLRRAARQERQHRLRVAAAEARRTASSAVADPGRRGGPPGRRAAGTLAGRGGRRTGPGDGSAGRSRRGADRGPGPGVRTAGVVRA